MVQPWVCMNSALIQVCSLTQNAFLSESCQIWTFQPCTIKKSHQSAPTTHRILPEEVRLILALRDFSSFLLICSRWTLSAHSMLLCSNCEVETEPLDYCWVSHWILVTSEDELTWQRAHLSPKFWTELWQFIEPYNCVSHNFLKTHMRKTYIVVGTVRTHYEYPKCR